MAVFEPALGQVLFHSHPTTSSTGGTTVSVVNETPGGTINSSNTAFTTAASMITGSLLVYQNGIRLKGGGVDFTQGTANNFTMVTAPTTGDTLLVDYQINAGTFTTGSTSFVINETPSGTVNGSNTAFDTASTYIAGSIQVYRDGQLMKGGGADYTETDSNTITFATAPVTGSVLLVSYQSAVSTAGNADTVDGYHANATPTAGNIPVLDANKLVSASGISAPSTDHITLTPGTSKLVKSSVLRQDNTTNTYSNNQIILTGWGWIDSLNGTTIITKAVTFGVTFSSAPVVLISNCGLQASGTPDTIDDFISVSGQATNISAITTTGFNANIQDVAGSVNYNFGFSWIAIGTLT